MRQDNKRVISNMLWMIFDKVFILLLNLVVTVDIANYFGVTEYGNYTYAVSVVAIMEIIVTFVDGRVVKKRYLDVDHDLLVFNATVCRVGFSVIAAVIGIGFVLVSSRGQQFDTVFSILLMNSILLNLRFGMANRFEYMLKSRKTVLAADVAALLSSFLQLLAVKLHFSIVAIAAIAAISSLTNVIIVAIQYRIEFGKSKGMRLDPALIRDMTKESFPLALAASCAVIYNNCGSIMLGNMMSDAEVGVYGIAVKLVTVVQIAIAPIRESVYPKLIELYARDRQAYARKYVQISCLTTWVYIIGVSLSFVILPTVLKVFKPEYAQAFSVYSICVLGTFFMYNAALRAGHFTMINKGSILTYTQLLSVIVNLAMNWLCIRKFGMYGAALATTVTQGISLMVSNLFFGKVGREVFHWQVQALNPLNLMKTIK